MDGEFKSGTTIEKEEMLVVAADSIGYTIDFVGEDDYSFEAIVVWENEALRNRIVELLNKYGVKDE